MRHLLRLFALTALLLTGMVCADAGTVLTYDFVTNHPKANLRIDQGYKEVRGNFAYWTGEWAGLFGNKICFATDSYPVLRSTGGLVDYHSSRKMYITNLSVGDKVTIYYEGDDPSVQFHNSGTARLDGITTQYQKIEPATTYTVTNGGYLCMLNRYVQGSATTIINKIVIESVISNETVDLTYGLCTYCSTVPLDFSENTALKAYVATGYENKKFIFKEVKYVPSDTGFLIVSQTASKTASVTVGRSDNYKDNYISTNLFKGILKREKQYTPIGKTCYMVGVGDGKVGIYNAGDNFYCNAKKAYLIVDE